MVGEEEAIILILLVRSRRRRRRTRDTERKPHLTLVRKVHLERETKGAHILICFPSFKKAFFFLLYRLLRLSNLPIPSPKSFKKLFLLYCIYILCFTIEKKSKPHGKYKRNHSNVWKDMQKITNISGISLKQASVRYLCAIFIKTFW